VAHRSFHSASQAVRPRQMNRRAPRASLIWPKIGSTGGAPHAQELLSPWSGETLVHGGNEMVGLGISWLAVLAGLALRAW